MKQKNFRESVKEDSDSKTDLDKEMNPLDDLKDGGMYGYLDWFYDGEIPGEDE